MDGAIKMMNKHGQSFVAALLLLINVGCVFLFYMIAGSMSDSAFDRTVLSVYLEYFSWFVLMLYFFVLIVYRDIGDAQLMAISLTLLNIFLVLAGLTCSMPFRLH